MWNKETQGKFQILLVQYREYLNDATIYLKNNDIIEIPYYNLFKARSKKRVLKQVEKVSNITKEFNLFFNSK